MAIARLSVLMSLYIKEKPKHARACFDSLLRQTVKADEWVVVEDGPLSSEMYKLLDEYQKDNPGLIKRVSLDKNQGLGLALRMGVMECKNELIARMDTDDIAREDRFEMQLAEFEKDPGLDICGSHIMEFEGDINDVLSKRTVPLSHNRIIEYQKTRSAFNHMTVMFKKSSVLKAGNYEHCPLMEDDMLWVRMIMSGAYCTNIDDFLVYARTGMTMIERRGGWTYYKKYRDGKRKMLDMGYIGKWMYFKTLIPQIVVCLMPAKLRMLFFRLFLR